MSPPTLELTCSYTAADDSDALTAAYVWTNVTSGATFPSVSDVLQLTFNIWTWR